MGIGKEQLIALGVSDDLAQKVLSAFESSASLKDKEIESLKKLLQGREEQITSLKSFEGDAKKFKSELETLQKSHEESVAKHQSDLMNYRKQSAVRRALVCAEHKPHNEDVAYERFDLSRVTIDDRDNVIGFKEQYDDIVARFPFLFKKNTTKEPTIQGFNVHPASNDQKATKYEQNAQTAYDFGARIGGVLHERNVGVKQ